MTLRIPLIRSRHAKLISGYAPTLDAEDEAKEQFYSSLSIVLKAIPSTYKIILLGDFKRQTCGLVSLVSMALGKLTPTAFCF